MRLDYLHDLMRAILIALLCALAGTLAQAAPAAPAVRAEIEALLVKLQSSGCEFNRNGSWHSGADAKAHLIRKLEYLENKTSLRSTEQFIELAGTSSSSSGRPYQVKCGGGAAVPSAQWLTRELGAARSAAGASK